MIPIHTHKPKPTREDANKDETFQTLVENWLVSDALAMLNGRHKDGKPALVSGNRHHVSTLALWMDRVAAQEFSDDTTSGPQEVRGPFRLSLDQIIASNERRAKAVLEKYWDPSKIEGRIRGGKHGSWDGVHKGKTPQFTHADIKPYWHLPPRERMALALTKMSRRTFYRLAADMPDFMARMREQEQVFAERERAQGNLLDP